MGIFLGCGDELGEVGRLGSCGDFGEVGCVAAALGFGGQGTSMKASC